METVLLRMQTTFQKNLCLFNKKNWTFPQKYVNNVYMIPN